MGLDLVTDDLINGAARAGRLGGLTLYPTQDGRWQASLSADRVSWTIAIDEDPATALRRVLGEKPDQQPGAFD